MPIVPISEFSRGQNSRPFPQENCFSQWTQCTPETMRSTSALAYFFGRNIQEELDVPVGIIVAAWGGTTAETWTPRECVMSDPVLCDYPYESILGFRLKQARCTTA